MAINGKRTRNLFDPNSSEPFKLSRTKIELFLECPRCFYLDRRLGIKRPDGPPFTLNSAVDTLLKKEFDSYRQAGRPHPIMENNGVEAVPMNHPELDKWRHNFTGVQYLHKSTNLLVFGAIDDVWIGDDHHLIVVDYKSTSTMNSISLDDEYKQVFKRQMEVYQWLFRMNGFKVSDTGYFVYANGRTDLNAFNAKLEFNVELIAYNGNSSWVDGAVSGAHKCLMNENLPDPAPSCKYCNYRTISREVEG